MSTFSNRHPNAHGFSSTPMTFVQWNHSHQILTDADRAREIPSSWPENVSFPDSNHLHFFFETPLFARSFCFWFPNTQHLHILYSSNVFVYIIPVNIHTEIQHNRHILFSLTLLHYDSIVLQCYSRVHQNFYQLKVVNKLNNYLRLYICLSFHMSMGLCITLPISAVI